MRLKNANRLDSLVGPEHQVAIVLRPDFESLEALVVPWIAISIARILAQSALR